MSKITDFLRKIGLLRVSSGDAVTGEFDSREDLKNQDEQEPAQEETQEGETDEEKKYSTPQEEL